MTVGTYIIVRPYCDHNEVMSMNTNWKIRRNFSDDEIKQETASWYTLLSEACQKTGENVDSLLTTLSDEELRKSFFSGHGTVEGLPFTAWGDKFVYFPLVYDGLEWVGYAPRNPCDKATFHWGR